MKTLTLLVALAGSSAAFVEQTPLASSGVTDIPLNGFGTWNIKGDNISDVVAAALETGYRHIDCATAYGNQKEVGKGLKQGAEKAGLKRSDFWVTSKLWNDHHKASLVPKALNQTLSDLGLDYLDLWLMHWPVAKDGDDNYEDFVDTWRAMSLLLATGTVKHIGVCNFDPAQLKKLIGSTKGLVKPYAHQMELHPYLPQSDWIEWHAEHGIHVTAYSPLGNMNPTYDSSSLASIVDLPKLLDNPVVTDIAEARGCTPAQVALKWGMSRGASVIPKSIHVERIQENFDSPGCELEDEDFDALKKLPVKRFNNPSKGWGVHLFEGLQDSGSASAKVAEAAWSGAMSWWTSAKEKMSL